MFTGIIQKVVRLIECSNARLVIPNPWTESVIPLGASIAVNGVCLTVVKNTEARLEFDLSSETYSRTSFCKLKYGATLNLEGALRLGDPIDGHIVSGHVDGIVQLIDVKKHGESYDFSWAVADSALMQFIAIKGSVVIDGVSLTVTALKETVISAAVVPYTFSHTNFSAVQIGYVGNIEVDILARYINRMQTWKQ